MGVVINGGVEPTIIKDIEFQIGGFKVDSRLSHLEPPSYSINIYPYDNAQQFKNSSREIESVFYTNFGLVGAYLDDPKESLFIRHLDGEVIICADRPNFLINLYIQLLIVNLGYSMCHAAGFVNKSNQVILITGAGGIGKTAVLGHAVGICGLKHLGDDILIIGGKGECLAYPREFVLKDYHKEIYAEIFKKRAISTWNLYKIKRFFIDNAPFVSLAKNILKSLGRYEQIAGFIRPQAHLATVPPDEVFGAGTMANSGKIGAIIYMDRVNASDFSIATLSKDSLVNRMFSVIHYEWKDSLNHLLSLGALNVFSIDAYINKVPEIFNNVTKEAVIFQVNIPKNASPEELIKFLESKNLFNDQILFQ